tara:strand:+ start:56376 stop:57260 length:885 start_codon:yes stop_codon:yes gene_type:complete
VIHLLFVFLSLAYSQNLVFSALGDTGMDNSGQAIVAENLKLVCQQENCNFGLMLGDIIYKTGPKSAEDEQFYHKYEKYYSDLDFPFYSVLGNHDYGLLARSYKKADYYLEYAKTNPQFLLPNLYYYFEAGDVLFIALDTNRIMNGKLIKEQAAMIKQALKNSSAKWVLVYGHHPYLSNGPHGNAGRYEDLPLPPVLSGKRIKKFFDQHLCGKMDVYYSGHDHSLQILPGNEGCAADFVVSGAGAEASSLFDRNPVYFMVKEIGFVLTKVYDNYLSLEVRGIEGSILHTHEITKD